MTSATTRAQPSPASSLRTFVHTNSTRPGRFTLDSLASCTPLLRQDRLAYWLALLWIIPPVFADEGNAIPTPEPSLPWPFNQGPPGLGGFIFAITIAITIIVCIYSKRKWPQKFQDPAPGLILLGCCTFSGFCIMGDGTASITTLLRYRITAQLSTAADRLVALEHYKCIWASLLHGCATACRMAVGTL